MTGGFAATTIELAAGDDPTLALTLHRPDTSRPACDSLTGVDLAGAAIVEPDGPPAGRFSYLLDVNGDQTPDYRLAFGPSWYIPPSGAVRPQNGDAVTVHGGMFSYGEPPTIIVYELNGELWREGGHGGHGGMHSFRNRSCMHDYDRTSEEAMAGPQRIELDGQFWFADCIGDTNNPPGVYEWGPEEGWGPSYLLNFGVNFERPDWDWFAGTQCVIGGLVEDTLSHLPWIIVYEIRGEFIREPGDTLGLAPVRHYNAVDSRGEGVPRSHVTVESYPNPFNATTAIRYSLPAAGTARVAIFDLSGREVVRLAEGPHAAGSYTVTWNAAHSASGLYFCRVESGREVQTRKLMLLR